MNLSKLISIKERIAIDDKWTPEERDYVLRAINRSIQIDRIETMLAPHGPAEFSSLRHLCKILEGGQSPAEEIAEFMIKKASGRE